MSGNLFQLVVLCVALLYKPAISQLLSDVLVGSPVPAAGVGSAGESQNGTSGNSTGSVNGTQATGSGLSNATSSPGYTLSNYGTQAPSNGSVAPANSTTAPSNGTAASANSTAAPSNGTAASSNNTISHNYYNGSYDSGSSGNSTGSTALPSVLTTLTVLNGTRIPDTVKKIIKKLPEMIELLRELYHYFIVEANV